jgi:hypothetical protein
MGNMRQMYFNFMKNKVLFYLYTSFNKYYFMLR